MTIRAALWILLALSFQLGCGHAKPVAITSLDLSKVRQGHGAPRVDGSVDKHLPLTINDKIFVHGLGTLTDSYFAIKLDQDSTRFSASVGMDDEAKNSTARIKFFVYGDNKIIWQSDELTSKQDAQPVDVNVTGITTLLLIATETDDDLRGGHADWADATLEVTGAAPVAMDPPATDSAEILTPPVPDIPRINGAKVFGVRPGSPFLYTMPVSGKRPMQYSAANLPQGLTLDSATGIISGTVSKAGTFNVTLQAKNDLGTAEKDFKIVVGDQIALTPPMGWNTYNCWANKIDQDKVSRVAHAMVNSCLIQHGFTYICVDDGWQGARGGPYLAIQSDPKTFPKIKAMIDEIHGLGLKVGIYSSPWTTTYAGFIGGSSENPEGTWDISMRKGPKNKKILPYAIGKYHFATNDAKQWGDWGIDYLKYDWSPMEPPETKEMADALKATGRDIVFSLSNNTTNTLFHDLPEISKVANLWRISGDINDSWRSLRGNAMNRDQWSPFNKPGNYNDPDMMVLGVVSGHPSKLTHNEEYSHMSLWCLLSAPLILGCDLEKLDDFTKGLLTNDEVLEIDQDTLCKQATVVSKQGLMLVYAKHLDDGSWAVGLFNLGPLDIPITLQWSDLGITGKQVVRDVWRQKDLGTFEGTFSASVGSHGVVLVRVYSKDQTK
jgi:alpha-galactosidase